MLVPTAHDGALRADLHVRADFAHGFDHDSRNVLGHVPVVGSLGDFDEDFVVDEGRRAVARAVEPVEGELGPVRRERLEGPVAEKTRARPVFRLSLPYNIQ